MQQSSIGPKGTAPPTAEETFRGVAEEEAEKWAAALGVQIQEALPAGLMAPTGSDAGMTAPWRPADNGLTSSAVWRPAGRLNDGTAVQQVPGSAGGGGATDDRVRLSVDGGDLGRVDLELNRDEQGIRVVIAVANGHAAGAMGPELQALERVLRGSGLSVSGVTLVQHAKDGPNLALRTGVPDGPKAYRERKDTTRKRQADSKRVHVVG